MSASDIAQSDLAELLNILGMGDHARPQPSHEVFQEALSVLEMKLWSQEGRIVRLAASASALVNMLRSRPDIHALCGFEEREILAEACAALNAEMFINEISESPRSALKRIVCLCGGWEKTRRPNEQMPYELARILEIALAAIGSSDQDQPASLIRQGPTR